MVKSILVILGTVLVAWAGSTVTSAGMTWYKGITLPSWTPPGSVIGFVWTIIFVLSAIAAIKVLNADISAPQKAIFTAVLILNGILNFGWSWTFFGNHFLGWAVFEAFLLELSVLALIIIARPVVRMSAYLLMPYAVWVAFATYLTYVIWSLNR